MFLRAPYNYDVEKASDEAGLSCKDGSRTKQSFKEEVDINTLVKRFGLDGALPQNVRMPVTGDFTMVPGDFHALANSMRLAQESFDAMPARVRARFHNDPAEFVDFCLDDANRDEAVKLGLVDPAKLAELVNQTTPVKAPVSGVTPSAPSVAPSGS